MKAIRCLALVAALVSACQGAVDPPADHAATQSILFPITPPTVIKPFTSCSGPAWDLSCDAIVLLPESQAITGPGTYECVTWCAGTLPNRIPRPNFAGWVQSRTNPSDWRRAYRFSIRGGRDLAAAICAPTQSSCAVAYRWPLEDGNILRYSMSFLNEDDAASATDGDIRAIIVTRESPDRTTFTRHDDMYSLATTTYAATSAHQVVFTSVPGGPPLISRVDPTTPMLYERFVVWF